LGQNISNYVSPIYYTNIIYIFYTFILHTNNHKAFLCQKKNYKNHFLLLICFLLYPNVSLANYIAGPTYLTSFNPGTIRNNLVAGLCSRKKLCAVIKPDKIEEANEPPCAVYFFLFGILIQKNIFPYLK